MTLNRLTVLVAVAGMILSTAPVSAGALSIAGPLALTPHSQVEQIRYVRHGRGSAFPAALIGGILSGVVGGAIGGGCYFNDCGYGDSGDYYGDGGGYYGGGYYGGGYGGGIVRGGHGGGRGFAHGGGAHGAAHAGGAHGAAHAGGAHGGGGARRH